MADRLDLQTRLETILGSRNVYFQPPENVRMAYPAIRYTRLPPVVFNANNRHYNIHNRYEVILIGATADSPLVRAIMELPYCTYERHYSAENLYHDVFTLYY